MTTDTPNLTTARRKRRSHLQKVCEDFTRGLLDGEPSTSMCYVVCTALAGFLGFFERLRCEPVEGMVGEDHHWWLSAPDGGIIDPTADQFNGRGNPDMPLVYIGPMPSWYRLLPTTPTSEQSA